LMKSIVVVLSDMRRPMASDGLLATIVSSLVFEIDADTNNKEEKKKLE
jgi:hypothetical protein